MWQPQALPVPCRAGVRGAVGCVRVLTVPRLTVCQPGEGELFMYLFSPVTVLVFALITGMVERRPDAMWDL